MITAQNGIYKLENLIVQARTAFGAFDPGIIL